ncbi:MAG: hypothetical protein Phog2KO_04840 [Phototrophicaceae bacterium]
MDTDYLESVAQEICEIFDVYAPPVPIELMLQQPVENMWEEVDVTQLSGSFMSIKERFSPRMSVARLLVRHIILSEWGQQHNITHVLDDKDSVNHFARMLLMPKEMVLGLTSSMRNPKAMSTHFEVPESDAQERLLDLN